jgi:hypothetical protein
MRWWAHVVLMGMLGAGVSCSPAVQGAAGRPVPAYGGRSAELFDDMIEASAVGLDPEAPTSVRGDSLFRERVQISDASLRVIVDTITVKQEESGSSYQVGFRTVDKLAGVHPPPENFSVRIGKESPSSGILKSYESQLIGKRFIAFIRLFGRGDGDREYHFHLAPDTKDVVAAVKEATILDNFRN